MVHLDDRPFTTSLLSAPAGVRSIEHGNWLDEETAALMVERGAFLVPTTVTYAALRWAQGTLAVSARVC